MKDLEMTVSLMCNVCGNDQFLCVDESVEDLLTASDEVEVKCSDCGRITTKEQIIEENSHIIDANIEDFAEDIIKQMEKKISKMFR